jgi:hypothetical protein
MDVSHRNLIVAAGQSATVVGCPLACHLSPRKRQTARPDLLEQTSDALPPELPHDAVVRSISVSRPSSSFCGLFTHLEIGHTFMSL